MSIPDLSSRKRLAAMGVTVWVRRGRAAVLPELGQAGDARPASGFGDELRIRLASGTGNWLLVQRQPWTGRHEQLLSDITATLGTDHCRFGQWAVSDSAGITLDECPDRGIDHVLSFGPPPRDVDGGRLLTGPSLEELSRDAGARKALWQLLAPELDR